MDGQNQQQPFAIPISSLNGMPMPMRLASSNQSPATSSPASSRLGPITTTYRLITDGPFTRVVTTPGKAPLRYVPKSTTPLGGQQQQGAASPRYVVKRQSPAASPVMKLGANNQMKMVMMSNNNGGSPISQQQHQQYVFNQQQQQQQVVMAGSNSRILHQQQHAFGGGGGQMIQQQQGKPPQGKVMRKTIKKLSPASSLSSSLSSVVSPPKLQNASPASSTSSSRKSILMRLRCRTKPLPLHSTYYDNESNEVLEKDADVIFMCGDGGRVRGHKVILASQSKFFTDAFQDQPIGETTLVSIPDISSDVMKLILLLAYKRSVIVNSDQIEKIKDYFDMFGVDFENLSAEPPADDGGPLDVNPGVVVENIQQLMSSGGGGISGNNNNNLQQQQGVRRKMMPSFTSEQLKKFAIDHRDNNNTNENFDGSEDEETFKILGYTNNATAQNETHLERRKAKLTPRIVTEIQDGMEADMDNFPEPDENMIKNWMQNVGKNDPDATPQQQQQQKRFPLQVNKRSTKYECKTCSAIFFKESAWKWHEERHYNLGIYKCTLCDALKTTARAIWIHEEGFHNFVGLPLKEIEEPNNNPTNVVDSKPAPAMPAKQQPPKPMPTTKPASPQKMDPNNSLQMLKLKKLHAARQGNADVPGLKPISSSVPALVTLPVGQNKTTYNNRPSPQQTQTHIKVLQPEEDEVEVRKIKQLQWIYICARCDNISDNLEKAHVHVKKCYPDGDIRFESVVARYRQGFYGRSKCPLGKCPRRYISNGGWTIHVGHQHEMEYRKLFSHTGFVEDKIKCENCFRKFGVPEDFHSHLQNGQKCIQSPINNSEEMASSSLSPGKNNNPSSAVASGGEAASSAAAAGGSSSEKIQQKTLVDDNKKEESKQKPVVAVKSKPVPIPPTPPVQQQPPRSARLAKRASALLMEKVLHDQDNDLEDADDDNEYSKKSTPTRKRAKLAVKRTSITSLSGGGVVAQQQDSYPPIECPICGSEIVDFSHHFSTQHKDMNVSVDRLSADLLKCRQCLMTFGIDDIFGHPLVCGKNKQPAAAAAVASGGSNNNDNNDDARSEISNLSGTSSSPPRSGPGRRGAEKLPFEIPPGIGTSPINEMEHSVEELMNEETILAKLTCSVCKKEAPRMGLITNCLKNQHGIHRCSICFNTFSERKNLDLHMKACHLTPSLRAKCPMCPDKAFINIGQCVGHMHIVHWADFLVKPKNRTKAASSSASSSLKAVDSGEMTQKIENDSENKTGKEPNYELGVVWDLYPEKPQVKEKDDDAVPELGVIPKDDKETDDSKMDESKPAEEDDKTANETAEEI